MRSIINISLPDNLAKYVKTAVKKGKYATTSEYFRHLVRQHEELQLVKKIKQSQRNMKVGKKHLLVTLKDLR